MHIIIGIVCLILLLATYLTQDLMLSDSSPYSHWVAHYSCKYLFWGGSLLSLIVGVFSGKAYEFIVPPDTWEPFKPEWGGDAFVYTIKATTHKKGVKVKCETSRPPSQGRTLYVSDQKYLENGDVELRVRERVELYCIVKKI